MESIRLNLKQFFNNNKNAKDEFINSIESVYPMERNIICRFQESTEKLLDWVTEHHQCIPILITILKQNDQIMLLKDIQAKASEYGKSGFKKNTSPGIFLGALMTALQKECDNIKEDSNCKRSGDLEKNTDERLFHQNEALHHQNKKEQRRNSEQKECVNVEEESERKRSDYLEKKSDEKLFQQTDAFLHQNKKEQVIISEKTEYTCEISRKNINEAAQRSDETVGRTRQQMEQLRSRISKLKDKLPTLTYEVSTLKEQISTKEDKIQKLTAAKDMLNEQGNILRVIILENEREIQTLQKKKRALQGRLEEAERKAEEAQSSTICTVQ